jgi:hypothetical protein
MEASRAEKNELRGLPEFLPGLGHTSDIGRLLRNMRITGAEEDVLVSSVRQADRNARIWLFGSRLDDSKKGGDIDTRADAYTA